MRTKSMLTCVKKMIVIKVTVKLLLDSSFYNFCDDRNNRNRSEIGQSRWSACGCLWYRVNNWQLPRVGNNAGTQASINNVQQTWSNGRKTHFTNLIYRPSTPADVELFMRDTIRRSSPRLMVRSAKSAVDTRGNLTAEYDIDSFETIQSSPNPCDSEFNPIQFSCY